MKKKAMKKRSPQSFTIDIIGDLRRRPIINPKPKAEVKSKS